MNEELKNKSIELINFLLQTLKQTKGFVSDQAPDILQQMVTRELVIQGMWGIILFIVLALTIYSGIYFSIKSNKNTDFIGLALFSFFASLVSLIISLICITNFISVYVAPKVFLLESLTNLLK